ncbi:transcription initiation factor IIB family protein [Halorubrum pallidum]|uniref:Transcription initiation factor IIB family protein n=1 Tax=Halorubrum pallidum TaxID=1526114 RepID=A0ABD5SYK2_9EURY
MARTQALRSYTGPPKRGTSGPVSNSVRTTDEKSEANRTDTEQKCSECGGRLRQTSTETVCQDCGLVSNSDPIDRGPEWRSLDSSNNMVRCNGRSESILLHDKGLGSEVQITPSTGRLRRQAIYQKRSQCVGGERGLRYILSQIRRIASRLSLPDYAKRDAAYYARRAHEQGVASGRSLEWITGGAIYAAIRKRELPVLPSEVAEYLREDDQTASGRKGVLQAYSHICRELGLSITPMLPQDYLPRLFDELPLRSETKAQVRRVLDEVQGQTGGATPSAVAAGAVRLLTADDTTLSLKKISTVYGHTTKTVRNNAARIDDLTT